MTVSGLAPSARVLAVRVMTGDGGYTPQELAAGIQAYLRSQPVNSEEGAPMGIGIWYEMYISDTVAFLFKNTDPRGSLRANVSNATVRCLSNMPLAEMLDSATQRGFGDAKRDALPRYCRECEVLAMCNGGCPKDRFVRAPDGGEGLNYLCEGYKRFFTHCRPFIDELAVLWRKERRQDHGAKVQPGRNDPCPCGSGKKYKKCHGAAA
mgnify:CR=1 FL=1